MLLLIRIINHFHLLFIAKWLSHIISPSLCSSSQLCLLLKFTSTRVFLTKLLLRICISSWHWHIPWRLFSSCSWSDNNCGIVVYLLRFSVFACLSIALITLTLCCPLRSICYLLCIWQWCSLIASLLRLTSISRCSTLVRWSFSQQIICFRLWVSCSCRCCNSENFLSTCLIISHFLMGLSAL